MVRQGALALGLTVVLSACGGSGVVSDAGVTADAGVVVSDAGVTADAGVVVTDAGAGPAACGTTFASCSTFEDRTAAGASRTINFVPNQYTPRCLRIKAGQTVTFSGAFGSHPLQGACGASAVLPASQLDTGSTATFTFSTAGLYGYFCTFHGSSTGGGMAGAIQVDP